MNPVVILLLTLFFVADHSKKETCKSLHAGVFYLRADSGREYSIMRTADKQVETLKGGKMVAEFQISWVDDCTYLLFNRRMIEGVDPSPAFKDTLVNKISEIKGKMHFVTATVRGKELKFKLERIE